jgi:diguanylate cyclase (GGDEF)-like protein/PAS domain S-box-containing protein
MNPADDHVGSNTIPPAGASVDDRYLLETFLQTTPDHVYFKDTESRFTRVSLALARWMGLQNAAEVIGRSDHDYFAEEHASKAFADEQRIMRTREPQIGQEEREVWPDGTVSWVSTTKVPLLGPSGEVLGIFGLSRDITERRLAAERMAEQSQQLEALAAQLEELSLGDELTGLHNRRGLRLLGGSLVDLAVREGSPLCVLFIDLDGLKPINDTLGHAAGDQALIAAANVLRAGLRTVDIVGRIGGDEFAVVLAGTTRVEALRLVARLRVIAAGECGEGLASGLSLSIGVATLGEDGAASLDDLIDVADRAMYDEKHARRAA